MMKRFIPPIVYEPLRRMIVRPQRFSPSWQTLSFDPLKGFRIYFDVQGKWQKEVYEGRYDDYLFDRISKLDLRGKTVVDVGAFIGYHSYYFSRLVGDKGRVVTFEPVPWNAERIRLIASENKISNIEIKQIALSDAPGRTKFYANKDIESGRSSGGFVEKADTIWQRNLFKQKGFEEIEAETRTLDSYDLDPAMIKIDVEGAEFLVLKGAIETLKRSRPILYIEIHSMLNMFEVTSLLDSLSYRTKILHQEKDGRTFIESLPY